jgi:hypothetical protein
LNKNQKQRQRKQYCFFYGEDKGHVTRDCLEAKETQERIKSRANPQSPPQQTPREVNHTFALPKPKPYCPIYLGLNSTQIHPSTLASTYYPNFLLAWRPTSLQPQASNLRAEANLTYINPRPSHITYIETSRPQQPANGFDPPPPPPHPTLPPPPYQVQLPPPKNKPNLENQINLHTTLPTIGMILLIAGGSTMEFQTKKQKKDHLRLVNNIAVQGLV